MTGLRKVFGAAAVLLAGLLATAAGAADRADLRAFLEITGFDVAIASMQQGAMAGPGLAGEAPDAFGRDWISLAEKVFDPERMIDRALDMMEAVMPDDLVEHGAAFYASALGQRLAAAENESHMTPDEIRYDEGEAILAALAETDPDRIEDYRAMADAIGGVDATVRAVIEIQLRYLMAAMAAGSDDIAYSEDELRALLAEQAPQIRENIAVYSLLGSAYAYRDFTAEEVRAYRVALEAPKMRQVYEILNAIQYEVMAERYETLAAELAKLAPQQDI